MQTGYFGETGTAMRDQSRKEALWAVVLLIMVCAAFLLPNSAYSQSPVGALQGEVQDATQARIPSATVIVRSLRTSLERQAATDGRGEFRITDLAAGEYRVLVSAKGFADATSDVVVNVSSVQDVMVTLRPAAPQQTVTVTGEGSSITTQPLDTTSAVQQGVVTAQDLATIPLASRSFANVAYLVPGTAPVEPSDPTKARITAVSFGGSSGLNVQLTVDGGDNSDDYIGGFLQNFSTDALQEFTVQTSQENADVGRTVGGAVVIATKSGTDQWHGGGAFYGRASGLNARFPIENPSPDPKQPFSRQNYVGTIGGPIRPGKLWIFAGFEYVHENASIAYSPASQDQFNALADLAAQGLIPGVSSIPVPNIVPVPFRDYLGSMRIDWSQSPRSQWFLRPAVDNYTTHNNLIQQGTLESTGTTSHSNYLSLVLSNQFAFTPTWLGSFVFNASGLHHTEIRNSNLGFALAFPFSATSSTVSGFETFGDQQFVTGITAFPVLRNQQKYQFRYDVSHVVGAHSVRFGVDFIHEPVLSGALASTAQNLTAFPLDPTDYVANPAQFSEDLVCGPNATPGASCTSTPDSNGSFSQNVQRLGMYVMDSWRITPRLTVNYGLRYDTTFGLFEASGRSQADNPAVQTMNVLHTSLAGGIPHDYRKGFGPRLGIVYSPRGAENLVFRGGFGVYFNDMTQNGWVPALQAVNMVNPPCVQPGDPGCLPGAASDGQGAIIDPNYHTPYALHASAGVQYAINRNWIVSADWSLQTGMHAYRGYSYMSGYTLTSPLYAPDQTTQMDNVPNVSVYKSDNRSSYNALMVHVQGNVSNHFNLTANYVLASAKTWGCVVGELFDYVNGVCNPLNAFGPGDYGPSGEDVRNRFVLAGTFYIPWGFQLTALIQAESARPLTLTTPVDVNGVGDPANNRAVINGIQTSLDQFRGTPYSQFDLRVARPIKFGERWSAVPFIEFFNLFNRNNPGNNYITDISALPNPVNDLFNATQVCGQSGCVPIVSSKQFLYPAGALGDFFGPGTTVGIPFAAQIGVKVNF